MSKYCPASFLSSLKKTTKTSVKIRCNQYWAHNDLAKDSFKSQKLKLTFKSVIIICIIIIIIIIIIDRLCGLVVRVLGYRSGGLGSISGTTRKKRVVGLERGPLNLVSTN
jgi:hypothetical protein